MAELTTSVDIDAPPATVWQVLTDFSSYPGWNDYMHISGQPTVGSRLHVSPGPAAGRLPTFKPRVLTADENRELRWLGHFYVNGLFDGEHRFVIDDLGDGRSRFTQSETFSGLLVGPFNRLMSSQTERNFNAVNAALKERAESLEQAAHSDTAA
ncbi:SRPBCC domain-containing protein [Haladaptatus sp. DJG-WS-42]|uniref:SRPBCC domain-containing protein n=1 Tax=Haladaptatus sp. DJG-WS-42 TaxID=3120516 RepID=UPI0030CF33C3